MKPANVEANRQVFAHLRAHQIVFIQYSTFRGLATIVQVQHKVGKGGDTSLLLRFKGQEKLQLLSRRDENLLAIKPLTLEEVEAYLLDELTR
jgi:hypothetical protein